MDNISHITFFPKYHDVSLFSNKEIDKVINEETSEVEDSDLDENVSSLLGVVETDSVVKISDWVTNVYDREGETVFPYAYRFTKIYGQKSNLPVDANPSEYFSLFFDDDLFHDIVQATNKYAIEKIRNIQLFPTSIWKKWVDVSVMEMKAFLGIIINMGLIPLPEITDYWSNEWVNNISFFGDVMSRNRFLQIYRMLQIGNASITDKVLTTSENNVSDFMKKLETKFQKYFVPDKYIAIEENVVGLKDPKKPGKCSTKLFVLVDGKSRYVHSVVPYFRETAEICSSKYEHIVLKLIDQLASSVGDTEGYRLYTNGYSSVNLIRELYKRKCYLTKTMSWRMGNPVPVRNGVFKKLEVTDMQPYQYNEFSTDKQAMSMVNNHQNNFVETDETVLKNRQGNVVTRPIAMLDISKVNYTKGTSHVNQNSMYCPTYCFIEKSSKWWRKLFIWCMEVSIANAYIIYCYNVSSDEGKRINNVKFRKSIVEILASIIRNPRKRAYTKLTECEERLDSRQHFTSQNAHSRKYDCRVCSNRKIKGGRKQTSYFCKTCSSQPYLCVGKCFENYHTLKKYKA